MIVLNLTFEQLRNVFRQLAREAGDRLDSWEPNAADCARGQHLTPWNLTPRQRARRTGRPWRPEEIQ